MSESLRNDGRVWVPKKQGDKRPPDQIPEDERDYYLERKYPSFGNLVPRDVASRNAKQACDEGRGVGESGLAVYLDFKDAIQRIGVDTIKEKYGNLFQMYQKITDEDPYKVPMRIYPAIHYTMGGLWVDYNLMSTIPGLHVLGEANFSDHGANRLGASALMQGLADGYFVIPYTIGDYLASTPAAEGHDRPRRVQGSGRQRAEADQRAALGEGRRRHPRDPPRARRASVGRRRDGADRSEPRARARGDSRSCATTSGTTCRCPARRTTSIRASSTPAASPTTSSSPSCWRSTRSSAASRAAAISAKRARRPTAKRCATTRTIPTSPRGNSRRRPAARAAQGAARVRRSAPHAEELQVDGIRDSGFGIRTGTNPRESANPEAQIPIRTHRETETQNLASGRSDQRRPPRRLLADDVSPDMSFLEMLDVVNEGLIKKGEDAIAFDSDCREGICGMCSLVVNGVAARTRPRHDRLPAAHAAVQGRRHDHDRAVARQGASPSSRISSSIAARSIASSRPAASCRSTAAARRTATPSRSRRTIAERAMDSAACIGCGACVAACKNASAHLFMSAKISHLAPLPQGQVERRTRASSR